MRSIYFAICLLLSCTVSLAQQQALSVASPDKHVRVICNIDQVTYTILYNNVPVLKDSKLGVVRDDEDFSKKKHEDFQ